MLSITFMTKNQKFNLTNLPVLKGILLALIGYFSISMMQVLFKWLAPNYHALQIMFLRNFIMCGICMVLFYRSYGIIMPKTSIPHLHLIRFFILSIAAILELISVSMIPLAEFTTLGFSTTFFVMIFSAIMLGEKVGMRRVILVASCFVGILLIVNPTMVNVDANIGYGLKLITIMLVAWALVQNKILSWWDSAVSIVYIFSLSGVVIYGVAMPFVWKTPNLQDTGLFLLLGLSGYFMQYFLTTALDLAPAVVISPLKNINILWNVMWGYVIWNEVPEGYFWIGASLIVLSNFYLAYYDAKSNVKTAAAKASSQLN